MKIRILIPRIHLKTRRTWRLLLMPAFRSSLQESQGQASQPGANPGLTERPRLSRHSREYWRTIPDISLRLPHAHPHMHLHINTHADTHRPHIRKPIDEPKSQQMPEKVSKLHHTKQLLDFAFVKQVGTTIQSRLLMQHSHQQLRVWKNNNKMILKCDPQKWTSIL